MVIKVPFGFRKMEELTWTLQETGTTESIQDIRMIDANIGFACGFNGVALKTENGGDTWTNMTTEISENFYTLDFHESRGYMGSYFGTILTHEFIAPGVTIEEFSNHNLKVYPNPTVESITLAGIDVNAITSIEVIDMKGTSIFTSEQAINNQIDCSNYNTGTYIVRIKTENGVFSRSFIKN